MNAMFWTEYLRRLWHERLNRLDGYLRDQKTRNQKNGRSRRELCGEKTHGRRI